MKSLADVLEEKYVVIGVTGPYAGESEDSIYTRKMREISDCGYTFWHHQSNQAKPSMVQELGRRAAAEGRVPYFLIIKASGRGSGSDTKKSARAQFYIEDEGLERHPIPQEIYVEVGRSPFALKISDMAVTEESLDLWDYSDFFTGGALKFRQGGSTVCAVRQSSRHLQDKIKSNLRTVVAYAALVEPYAVWLR